MTAYFSLIETDMIRQGVDADPHLLALLAATPKFFLKRIQPHTAAAAIVDGLERQKRVIAVPGRWRPFAALRGVPGPALDVKLARDPKVHSDGEVGKELLVPMALHMGAVIVLGLVPTLGLALVRAPVGFLRAPLHIWSPRSRCSPASRVSASPPFLAAAAPGTGAVKSWKRTC